MEKMNIRKMIVCFCMFLVTAVSYGEDYVFKSYHIYTTDEDRYVQANEQNADSKVCIDEVNKEIELSLYNREAGKWMTFPLAISYKVDIAVKTKIGTLYMCTNNTNQTCGVCIVNTEEGLLIDLHNFYGGEKSLSCWAKSEKN